MFGKPVALGSGSANIVAVLATNTTDQVKTFTVKATYKTGNEITATAVGTLNDLLPQQTRAVTLLSQSAIPATFDSVRVDIDTLVQSAKSTTSAEVASKQAFGKPAVRTNSGLTTVDVEVTNNDSKPHSYTVQAAFVKGNELVGVATGAVNDIQPGQTKTATLLTEGTTEGADTKVAVDTVVQ